MKQLLSNLLKWFCSTQCKVPKQLSLLGKPHLSVTEDRKRGKIHHGPHTERGLHWRPWRETAFSCRDSIMASWNPEMLFHSFPWDPKRALGSLAVLPMAHLHDSRGPSWCWGLVKATWSYALRSPVLDQRRENKRGPGGCTPQPPPQNVSLAPKIALSWQCQQSTASATSELPLTPQQYRESPPIKPIPITNIL